MSLTTERRLERGVTLVELIVFIVIVSTAVAGVLMTLDISNRSSADPMIQKQALAVAEALLEEVQLQPFTYCDPDDQQAHRAESAKVTVYLANRAWTLGEFMYPAISDTSANVDVARGYAWEVTTVGTSTGTPAWPASVTVGTTTVTQNAVVWTARGPGCSPGGVEATGAESTSPYGPESRSSATNPFDNVNDYNGFCMGPGSPACPVATISDLDGNSIPGLEAYRASVEVVNQALEGIAASDSLRITVTVTGPANTTVVLQGYRVRYAPNAVP
jgi:type II secretory pathway pseudopilin PulG